MNNRLEILKNAIPFNILPEDVLVRVADLLEEVKYTKEAVIYHQEVTKMSRLDIIVKGEYESFFYDSVQNKRCIEIHHTGFCYGGISILLNRKRSLKTVITKKGTVVYTLPKNDFIELCKSFEGFFHHFTAKYGQHLLDDEFAHFMRRPATFDESYIASDQCIRERLKAYSTEILYPVTVLRQYIWPQLQWLKTRLVVYLSEMKRKK
jgi:CBS domain-containing protein